MTNPFQIAPLPVPALPSERGPEAATVAIIGVTVLSLLALFAAGMTFLRHQRRARAATLQARVAEAIAVDVECARVNAVTVAASSATPASVTLEGTVRSTEVRDRVVRLAEEAGRRVEPAVVVIDQLTVEAERAA